MASLSSFPSALCEEDDVTKQGPLVTERVSEQDGGSGIAGSLGALPSYCKQLPPTQVALTPSYISSMMGLRHSHDPIAKGVPGEARINCEVARSHARLLLPPES